jgi:hypothetical protein
MRRGWNTMALLAVIASAVPLRAPAQEPAPVPQENTVEALPETAPAWPDGYQVRYSLRIVGVCHVAVGRGPLAWRLAAGRRRPTWPCRRPTARCCHVHRMPRRARR